MSIGASVSVPYEITLLSNWVIKPSNAVKFQYLMKLHYSQTTVVYKGIKKQFQYLMKLHYSQTEII